MKFDGTVTLSIILAISALISPVIVAVINNHHAFKMRKLELDHEEQHDEVEAVRNIFDNYLESLLVCTSKSELTSTRISKYASAYGKAIVYMKEDVFLEAQSLYEEITAKSCPHIREIEQHANSIRKSLSKELI